MVFEAGVLDLLHCWISVVALIRICTVFRLKFMSLGSLLDELSDFDSCQLWICCQLFHCQLLYEGKLFNVMPQL